MNEITIGSRGSTLALAQTNWVADQIRLHDSSVNIRVEIIRTTGDKILDMPLSKIGGKGLFVKEIEVALLESRIDLAVHSMKDLPTEIPDGLCIAAVPPRADQCDALVSSCDTVDDLPAAARVGSSSLRRRAQLSNYRPDLEMLELRGNLDTRLGKLDNGDFDAIILACAGLCRLGLESRIAQRLPFEVCVPAVGQGALALEARSEDEETLALLTSLDDHVAKVTTTAERALLAGLGGGCQTPIGAAASIDGDLLRLTAMVAEPSGGCVVRRSFEGSVEQPQELGRAGAWRLLSAGAKEILEQVAGTSLASQIGAA